MIDVFIDSIADEKTREALKKLISDVSKVPFVSGSWEFVEFTITSSVTIFKWPHKLGFKPQDIIILHQKGAGTLAWEYDQFTKTEIVITPTGITDEVHIRAYIGEVR